MCSVFLKEVESCSAQPLKISNIFKKNESKFFMYITYSQKSKIFDCFMCEYRLYFEVRFIHKRYINTVEWLEYVCFVRLFDYNIFDFLNRSDINRFRPNLSYNTTSSKRLEMILPWNAMVLNFATFLCQWLRTIFFS